MSRVPIGSTKDVSEEFQRELKLLVQEYRTQCLWFLSEDYYPSSVEQVARTLKYIEQHADRKGFVKARRLRQWLSQDFRKTSVGS